jgi:signal transduction histidine kinase
VAAERAINVRWVSLLPHAFVIFALAALVIIPSVINRRIAALQEEIIVIAEGARSFAFTVQVELAREMGTVRSLQARDGREELRKYRASLARQDTAFMHLETLSARLGPSVRAAISTTKERSRRWHDHVSALLEAAASRGGTRPSGLTLDESLYDDALQASTELERAVTRAGQERFFEIRTAETLESQLVLGTVILALAAAIVTAWLARRLQVVADEAQRRRDEVVRLLESKARLTRGITHDLKNPLSVIDGYAQLLAAGFKGELSPPQRESVSRIRNGVRSTLAIINDLLELARAETGELKLVEEEVDVVSLARDLTEDHRGEIELADLQLTFESPMEEAVVVLDADRVRAILGNLLSNARKYTPPGGHVRVSVTTSSAGPSARAGEWLAIAVIDDGPGIPPEQKEFIFQEFTRLEIGTGRGAGLGLAISRTIARLMQGDLTVDSVAGQGSTFTLWLPAQTEGSVGPGSQSRTPGTPQTTGAAGRPPRTMRRVRDQNPAGQS